jgi:uncharacterized protein
VALDSSVLIAAHITRAGVCAELLEDVLLHHELVCSEFIVGEVTRKLRETFHYAPAEVDAVAALLRHSSTLVSVADVPGTVCRDPNDLPVLGTAVAGQCQLLVSVDHDLLNLKEHQGIAIIRPGDFWRYVPATRSGSPSFPIPEDAAPLTLEQVRQDEDDD